MQGNHPKCTQSDTLGCVTDYIPWSSFDPKKTQLKNHPNNQPQKKLQTNGKVGIILLGCYNRKLTEVCKSWELIICAAVLLNGPWVSGGPCQPAVRQTILRVVRQFEWVRPRT